MTGPIPYKPAPEIDARLVTKTSLPSPKKAIAALIMMWYAYGKPGTLDYGVKVDKGGILDSTTIEKFKTLQDKYHFILNVPVEKLLSTNPLFTSQIESLDSAFELIWRLASFSFPNGESRAAERKGGRRFRKRIRYTTNIDLIDIMVADEISDFLVVLSDWLSNRRTLKEQMEKRLIRNLGIFSEGSFYRTAKGDSGVVYTPSGIYKEILNGTKHVEIVEPGQEAVGTTRILKAALSDGLNPMLAYDGESAMPESSIVEKSFRDYVERTDTTAVLSHVVVNLREKRDDFMAISRINEPRNLIFFGAPGTGKSHQLCQLTKKYHFGDVRRVTFYPGYTYSQFVGCFKPYMDYEQSKDDESVSDRHPRISYRYVAGPFLEMYLRALEQPNEQFLLIIEELNRASPAAVFGDVFQLLDRQSDGRSEYDIATPSDMRDYLRLYIKRRIDESKGNVFPGLDLADIVEKTEHISLPSNLYIWATMNSADQGVFPIDTAFKRRWDFRYIGIDQEESAIQDKYVPVSRASGSSVTHMKWNDLRKQINELLRSAGVNEDKLMGPFFISPDRLNDHDFVSSFLDKVLLYIYEDAGKTKRSRVFEKPNATYSELCEMYKKDGLSIFNGSENWPAGSNYELGETAHNDPENSK